MGELHELVAALEKVAEPSRELDLALLAALSGKPWRWHRRCDETITYEQYGPNALGNPICSLEEYSSSVDDALALCEGALPEWRPEISKHLVGFPESPHWRAVLRWWEKTVEAKSTTPALALCAVIVKGVIAMRETEP